ISTLDKPPHEIPPSVQTQPRRGRLPLVVRPRRVRGNPTPAHRQRYQTVAVLLRGTGGRVVGGDKHSEISLSAQRLEQRADDRRVNSLERLNLGVLASLVRGLVGRFDMHAYHVIPRQRVDRRSPLGLV